MRNVKGAVAFEAYMIKGTPYNLHTHRLEDMCVEIIRVPYITEGYFATAYFFGSAQNAVSEVVVLSALSSVYPFGISILTIFKFRPSSDPKQ